MKLSKITIVLSLLLLSFAQQASAQIDTAFWFAAPWVSPDHASNVPVVFRVSSFGSPTTVHIFQPAGAYDTTFLMPANSLTSVDVSYFINTLEAKPANTALDFGIKIESDTLITVVYEVVTVVNNPETYSVKGQNGLGLEFVTPFQVNWNNGSYAPNQPKQMFCIVATEDNTTIWITPKADVVGHPAGVTYSIILNRGQVYTAQNVTQTTSVAGSNLSGSIIVANKPIAVTVSDDSVANVAGGGCRDLMGDQIVPTDVIGTEYIINKGGMNVASQESFYVVATENFTQITITDLGGTTVQLLNQGDTYRYIVTQPLVHVLGTKPVYLLQASGFGCEFGEALLPPLNCAGSSQVSFTRTNGQAFFLNLLCPTSAINNFLLNGSATLVPGTAFSLVPGTGGLWSGAQIQFTTVQIPPSTTNLIENTSDLFALGVINGGSTSGCLFHYMSSFQRKVYTKAGNDTILCNGETSIDLLGSVSGGTNTGIWEVLDGTGVLASPTALNTTYAPTASDFAQGFLTFVLSSTGNCDPVTDTMKVAFIQSPIVGVGSDLSYCKNNVGTIPIAGSVAFASAGVWSGGNGGAIGSSGSLNTNYTPSPADLAADSVALFLTSSGSFFSCPNDEDTLVIYFTEAPAVIAGPDLVVCSNMTSVPLNGAVTGSSTTGSWTTSGAGAFSPSQTQLANDYLITPSDTSVGVIILTLTSLNNGNCLAVQDSLQLTIVPQPDIQITTPDSVCSNTSLLSLNGTVTGGFSTMWEVNGFGSITSPTNLNTSYTVSVIDTTIGYIDLILSTTGFCPVNSDSIRVHFIDPPQLNAGINQQFCQNEAIALNGLISGPNQTGLWTSMGTGYFDPGNAFLSTFYFPSADDISNGGVNLILSAPSAFGCVPDNDTIFAQFKAVPLANFSATSVCEQSNTVFTDNSTSAAGTINSWAWDFADASGSITSDPVHTYGAYGNYNVSLIVGSTNGCFDTLVQSVTVHPNPQAIFSNDPVCEGMVTQFMDNSFIPSGTITNWSWEFYNGAMSSAQNPTAVYPLSGSFAATLTVTSALGCEGSTTTILSVNPAPQADFTMNPNPALVLENVNFTDQSTGNQLVGWFWDFGDGQGDNSQNTIHNYANGGDYEVALIVTDINGCVDTAYRDLSIALLPVLPTGFSPNGDNENDVFIIRGGPFKSVDFKIYNNWGQLIYESDDALEGWNGMYQSENAPLGVYTWTFVVEMPNGQIIKKSGDVTLIR
ncbi:MAG: PKD domain-containing protein [Bacteroidota bacterium]